MCEQWRSVRVADVRQRLKHDRPVDLCSHCAETQKEKKHWTFTQGYVAIYRPEHPFASSAGYILEHRLVMEGKIGRYLLRCETVHHINGKKTDNRAENLELWTKDHGAGIRVKDLIRLYKTEIEEELQLAL